MAPRISRVHTGISKPKNGKNKSRARALNAFAIASAENPDAPKVRKARLGQSEDEPRDRKRRRIEDDDDDEDMPASDGGEDERPRQQKRRARRANVGSSEEGSDSEGNTWTLGHVGEDEDSDIDSDEAFGEGDDERFAGYAFSGSAENRRRRAAKKGRSRGAENIDLNDDNVQSGSDESLGEDAVDLAQMLDDYSESGDEVAQREVSASENELGSNTGVSDSEDRVSGSEDGSESSEEHQDHEEFSGFSSEEEDGLQAAKMSKLQRLISSLHPKSAEEEKRTSVMYESTNPSESGITLSEKVDVRSILNFGAVQTESKKSSKRRDLKLAPALPKLQQDKLDRAVANEKAKATLDRWVDTVKQMRRAEHVTFPLQDSESRPAHDRGYLLPSITGAPITDLEATISSILQESGLAADEQDEDAEFDELPTNEVSVQEILERRAQLRRARELIFQEEQRSKRIKKIKSKSYRRVHRREREKLEALDKDAFGSDAEMDDEERETHDRRRAEERMGAKHRDSKWAKQMKKSGRSIWDDEARSGVTEMARRNEELRRRIAGKDVRDGESGDESSSGSDEDVDQATNQLQRLHKNLKKLQNEEAKGASGSALASMKFMKRAEEARKAQNDEDIRRMQRELNDEESSEQNSEMENNNIGRQIFGPNTNKIMPKEQLEERNEFEEPEHTDEEQEEHITLDTAPMVDPSVLSNGISNGNAPTNPYTKSEASKKRNNKSNGEATKKNPDVSKSSNKINGEREVLSKPDSEGWITVTYDKDSDSDKSDSDAEPALDQAEFLSKAFAGDDVEEQFVKEKEEVIADEDDKVIDETLPGWGTWVGEGLSKRAAARNKGRVLVKREGIKRQDRKDAKLKNVIINQKRVRKNVGYLAPSLPFPYTSRQEYERSIRMPIGGEWNVKKTVGESTKPRVIVKPGRVVMPMEKPLV